MSVDFSGSGMTDGGLAFGGSAGFDTGDAVLNEGKVFISGAFGKISLGDNDPADKLVGGIADVGLNGIGVDDVAEGLHGGTASQLRYDRSVGNIAIAVSTGTNAAIPLAPNTLATAHGTLETKKNDFAVGMSFGASGARVGIGYDSRKAMSLGVGFALDRISSNIFYSKVDKPYAHLGADLVGNPNNQVGARGDGIFDAGMTAVGVDLSYSTGASTLMLAYARTDVDGIQPLWVHPTTGQPYRQSTATVNFASARFTGIGVGVAHDLGGGAKLLAGFARVPLLEIAKLDAKELGQTFGPGDEPAAIVTGPEHRVPLSGRSNKASVGLSFAF